MDMNEATDPLVLFEAWFAEVGAVVHAFADETVPLVPAHQASTQSRRM